MSAAIHDHELLCPIASGSYGEVWLGRNAVGTLRAVKIVRRDRFERAEDFEREFKGLQNFEPISRAHEGLVDILQIGRNDAEGWFYYVMELADGVSNQRSVVSHQSSIPGTAPVPLNTDHCSLMTDYSPRTLRFDLKTRGSLSADEVIALGLKLTAALAHLHAHGLVHRDVKPSNIFFIGGEPKLADAGLVAALDDARSLVGTVGYIAPEGPGTPQADLYALGKVLYEAAFGKDRQEFPQLPPDPPRASEARLGYPTRRTGDTSRSRSTKHRARFRFATGYSCTRQIWQMLSPGSTRGATAPRESRRSRSPPAVRAE